MNTKQRGLAPNIFHAVLAASLVWGCVPDKEAPPKSKTRAQAQKPRAPKPAPTNFKLELPALTKPAVISAGKVVHLLYTSNVDGELEPCG